MWRSILLVHDGWLMLELSDTPEKSIIIVSKEMFITYACIS